MIVLTLTPSVSVSCSRKSVCTRLNEVNEASSITPSTWSSNKMGTMARFAGAASPSPEEILMYPSGTPATTTARLLRATWPIRDWPIRYWIGAVLSSCSP